MCFLFSQTLMKSYKMKQREKISKFSKCLLVLNFYAVWMHPDVIKDNSVEVKLSMCFDFILCCTVTCL